MLHTGPMGQFILLSMLQHLLSRKLFLPLAMLVLSFSQRWLRSSPLLHQQKKLGWMPLTKLLRQRDQVSKLPDKICSGLVASPGKEFNGATTQLHAKPLLRNTAWWPWKLQWWPPCSKSWPILLIAEPLTNPNPLAMMMQPVHGVTAKISDHLATHLLKRRNFQKAYSNATRLHSFKNWPKPLTAEPRTSLSRHVMMMLLAPGATVKTSDHLAILLPRLKSSPKAYSNVTRLLSFKS